MLPLRKKNAAINEKTMYITVVENAKDTPVSVFPSLRVIVEAMA